jgi:hypothetical protein
MPAFRFFVPVRNKAGCKGVYRPFSRPIRPVAKSEIEAESEAHLPNGGHNEAVDKNVVASCNLRADGNAAGMAGRCAEQGSR